MNRKILAIIILFFIPILPIISTAETANLRGIDTPNDNGGSIILEWEVDTEFPRIKSYRIFRSEVTIGDMKPIGNAEPGVNRYIDNKVTRGKGYYYIIQTIYNDGVVANSPMIGPVVPKAQWFDKSLLPTAGGVLIISGILIFFIYHAKSGKKLTIRRIPGLEAIDEAIGRATEMGKSILYVSGIGGIRSMATIASMNILSRISRMAAEYETPLLVPCSDPVVMNIEREIIRNAHMDAGRPDTYRQENVFFITEEQFAYAAAVDGMIIREKPAAIFYMGAFMAESLILAEVGNVSGTIQVAGTDSITQLPFFIASCDYTLMGEELYAASAYLSKDPLLLGSLKGQDIGKLIVIACIIIGVILQLLGYQWFTNLFR
ncbi:hypothetical protein GF312_13325 [Candidatus Poribacteria bacterium]|nr:hypothetical protein [Candidatus Poribacteria bacterium]